MKKQKEKNEFKAARRKQAILEWTFGILLTVLSAGLLAGVFYFIGKSQGKW